MKRLKHADFEKIVNKHRTTIQNYQHNYAQLFHESRFPYLHPYFYGPVCDLYLNRNTNEDNLLYWSWLIFDCLPNWEKFFREYFKGDKNLLVCNTTLSESPDAIPYVVFPVDEDPYTLFYVLPGKTLRHSFFEGMKKHVPNLNYNMFLRFFTFEELIRSRTDIDFNSMLPFEYLSNLENFKKCFETFTRDIAKEAISYVRYTAKKKQFWYKSDMTNLVIFEFLNAFLERSDATNMLQFFADITDPVVNNVFCISSEDYLAEAIYVGDREVWVTGNVFLIELREFEKRLMLPQYD